MVIPLVLDENWSLFFNLNRHGLQIATDMAYVNVFLFYTIEILSHATTHDKVYKMEWFI